MLSALTTLLIQGYLPAGAQDALIMIFGLMCGISFAMQVLCIVLCIETLRLASGFMIRRAEKLNEDLKRGREDTKRTFDNLRELDPITSTDDSSTMRNTYVNAHGHEHQSRDVSWIVGDSASASADGIEASARIDSLWRSIEKKHYGIMKKRYAVNNAFAHKTNSFEVFWTQYCKVHNERAALLFYLGSMIMLIGIIAWAYMSFTIAYKSTNGAILCIIPIALSIPVGVWYKTIIIHNREITAHHEFMEREQRDIAETCKAEEQDYDKDIYGTFRSIAEEGDEPLLLSTSPTNASRVRSPRANSQPAFDDNSVLSQTPGISAKPRFTYELDEASRRAGTGASRSNEPSNDQMSRSGRLHPAANAAALQVNVASNTRIEGRTQSRYANMV